MQKRPGKFIIISGPSGVGKGTVLKALLEKNKNCVLAVSATTRPPRAHEADGKDYYFLSKAIFREKIKENAFLEWCEVHANLYGTLRSEVETHLLDGESVFLEIDTQGAKKIKNIYPDAATVFIAPPSFQDLFSRLKKRNTEADHIIKSRMAIAGQELASIGAYDYVIINESVDQAVKDFESIIQI